MQALVEEGRSSRAWLWTSASGDAVNFHVDPCRSTKAILYTVIANVDPHILAIVRRHLLENWTARGNTAPVLIETFVETSRHTGAVYKASGWAVVGTARGRGRYDRHTKRSQPKTGILLRPLRKSLEANAQSLNPPCPSSHNGTIPPHRMATRQYG